MNIYLKDCTNFNNNGLGFLQDIKSAKVIEALNGRYQLEMEYIINGQLSEYLVEENIIKCKVSDNTYQLFRIVSVQKTFKTIKVVAYHIFYDLLNNFVEDTYPQNLNGQAFLNHILTHTVFNNNFNAISDINNGKSARYVRRNPVDIIMGSEDNSMINLFGGEIKRNNFDISLLSRVGTDRGVKLLIGKNITGINLSIDITEMATKVMPQGYDGLFLPELYVNSPHINEYPSPKIKKVEFSNIKYDPDESVSGAYHNIEDAYQALRDAVNELYEAGLDKPKINITIDWIELSKTNEYKNYSNLEKVYLGDTVTAHILGLDYQTRVIETTFDVMLDRVTNFQIGTWQPSYASTTNNTIKAVKKIEPDSILAEAKNNATQLITTAMGGYIYKTQSELYIMDSPDPTTAQKVWRWNINGLGYSSTGINGPYGLAITMDGAIVADFITAGNLNTNVIQGYDTLVTTVAGQDGRISQITQSVNDLNIKIQNIANISVDATSDLGNVDLENVNASNPMTVKIKPIGEDISYLYPSNTLYPSNDLYMKNRVLRFTNLTTNETFDYELPEDLLWYDQDNYDELILSYGNGSDKTVYVNKKCKHTATNGVNELLSQEEIHEYAYPTNLNLSSGNYHVELLGYNSAYLYVQLMASNIYTSQYATIVEMNDKYITLQASKVGIDEVIARINLTAEAATIEASKINIAGVLTAVNNNTTTTINGNKITTGSIGVNQVSSDIITTNNLSAQNISANQITAGTLNGNNVSITNLNASNITSGTLNSSRIASSSISADKLNINNLSAISSNLGAITAGSINIGGYFSVNSNGATQLSNSVGFLSMKLSTHPYVSALNVATGSGGISFRAGNSQSSVGGQKAWIEAGTFNNSDWLWIRANGTVAVNGVEFRSGYVNAGNLAIGEHYINNDNGGQIAINKAIALYPSSGYYVYVGSISTSGRVLTNGGSPSTLNIKENVTEKDISDIPNILRQIKLYDYNYISDIESGKKDYGYIIDYLENIDGINNYLEFMDNTINEHKVKQVSYEKLIKLLLAAVINLQKEVDLINKGGDNNE